ncbi:Na/Pi cotransporter family protein [Staphylospora marina]|uniref:Na/Pi cotransporter family protein n=1 Tax=Staphylospora marina TaxID=2490858 RepID=UPI000F5BB250|nr:Na/Pi symporter [Staphylospora marina]
MFREIIVPFALGLVVFLFGLNHMRTGLEELAEDRLRNVLIRFTRTPVRGFFTGIVTTALLQSSTAVTVLTIGFVSAGMMTFAQSVGIILGTNIGTTVTTQILALKVEDLAVPLTVSGAVLWAVPSMTWSRIGQSLTGFGLIFLGIEWMQRVAEPIKEQGWLDVLAEAGGSPVVAGLAAGTILTALIHSSSATIAMTMGFYSSGAIDLPMAIAVVLGSNVGTCMTAVLATVGASRESKQVATAHLVLNLAGMLAFLPLIPWLTDLAPWLSEDPAVQIAHIQTLFNVICSVLVLPFCEPFARSIVRLTPGKSAW